ncbi:hypothetical protein TPE_1840 [Treponema pedis str. T A4]|uniref:Uncharacterized protein n=1 Tax=Treponema pedis str. T A4 TaxID=1291379 RepID=S6A8S0_9SPIR|nr:hypothetical protein TPE_1840 [Treponema pedis str. T A4]
MLNKILFLYIYRLKSIRTDNIHIFTIFAKFIKNLSKTFKFYFSLRFTYEKKSRD